MTNDLNKQLLLTEDNIQNQEDISNDYEMYARLKETSQDLHESLGGVDTLIEFFWEYVRNNEKVTSAKIVDIQNSTLQTMLDAYATYLLCQKKINQDKRGSN